MKQISSIKEWFSAKVPLSLFLLMLLLGSVSSKANLVVNYTPSCVIAGQTATIGVNTVTTWAGSSFHWQYRLNAAGAAPGPWIFLDGVAAGTPVNNTINGTVFAVSNANIIIPANNFNATLSIANSTTALNEVEFRVLVGPFGDPQVITTPVWNGDDQNVNEAKTVRMRIKPATENCFAGCAGNILVTTPPSGTNTPLDQYYGGFETAAANFGGTNPNGSSATAQTNYSIWTSGSPTPNSVGIINNPYAMIWNASRFAPRTGNNMLVVYQSSNSTDKVWYKNLVAPTLPSQQYFSGLVTLRVWASKTGPNVEAPCFALELKGTNAANVTSVLSTVPVTMTSTAGQPGNVAGDWVLYTLSFFVPGGQYKALEASVRGNCVLPSNYALDDICLVAPASSTLPLKLKGFAGTYIDGVSKLNWVTEQESNTNYFEIEHSIDGINFTALGKVAAAGNSSRLTAYKFDDVKAGSGTNYYRLKMTDKDGRFEYSNIVLINVNIKGIIVTGVYPSPFTDKINISISSESKAQANIRIFDNTGKMVVKQTAVVNKGVTIINVNNLAKLAKGFYIAEVQAGGTVYTQKIIK